MYKLSSTSLGASAKSLILPDTKLDVYGEVSEESGQKAGLAASEEAEHGQADADTTSLPLDHPAPSDKVRSEGGVNPQQKAVLKQQLADLQSQLRTAMKSMDRQKKAMKQPTMEVTSCLMSIQNMQEQLCSLSHGFESEEGAQSLQYLTHLACDLARLISVAYTKASFKQDKQRQLLEALEPANSQPLVAVARELFRSLVAYEQVTRSLLLAVIKDRIWSIMEPAEKTSFFGALVQEYLSKPERSFSQRAVVEALDTLRLPVGDLISFLVGTLGLGLEPPTSVTAPSKPFVMVSSILVLTLKELQRGASGSQGDGRFGERAFLKAQGKQEAPVKKGKSAKVGSGSQDEAAHNPTGEPHHSGELSDAEGSDELLEPLQPQRSLSVPISGPKGKPKRQTAARQQQEAQDRAKMKQPSETVSFDEDMQLLAVFRLAVWVCKQPEEVLATSEKASLLRHAVQNLNIMAQRPPGSVVPLVQVVQAGQGDLLELCISVLCLGDEQLQKDFKTLLEDRIAQPPALAGVIKYLTELRAAPSANADPECVELMDRVELYIKDQHTCLREGLRVWIQQVQGLLIWLIDRQKLGPNGETANLLPPRSIPVSSPWLARLAAQIPSPDYVDVWVSHLSFLLNGYILFAQTLMTLDAKLEPEGAAAEAEDDLMPLKAARSASLPISRQPHQGVKQSTTDASIQLIKSLMALLTQNEKQTSGVDRATSP